MKVSLQGLHNFYETAMKRNKTNNRLSLNTKRNHDTKNLTGLNRSMELQISPLDNWFSNVNTSVNVLITWWYVVCIQVNQIFISCDIRYILRQYLVCFEMFCINCFISMFAVCCKRWIFGGPSWKLCRLLLLSYLQLINNLSSSLLLLLLIIFLLLLWHGIITDIWDPLIFWLIDWLVSV